MHILFSVSVIVCHTAVQSLLFHRLHFILYLHPPHERRRRGTRGPREDHASVSLCLPSPSQTDEERQQALQAFTAQSFLGSPQHNTSSSSGSGASGNAFPSPTSSSEHRAKMKRGPRQKQNEKYQLKYLRLRKAARTMIFVSKPVIPERP